MPGDTADSPGAKTAGAVRIHPLNAAAILIVALYFGRELLVPLVLAVLLAFVLAPLVTLLQRARLGRGPSVLLAVIVAFGVIGGIGLVVGNQAANLAAAFPKYQATIQDKVRSFAAGGEIVARMAASVQHLLTGSDAVADAGAGAGAPAVGAVAQAVVPGAGGAVAGPSTLVVVRAVLQPLLSPLATLGITVVFTIFVLLSREGLRDRLVRLVGRRDLHRTILAMNDAATRLSQYFLLQLGLNTAFGVYITGALWIAGLPNPLLWGILAGTMRFVPFIGSFISVVPPVLLALAVFPGWGAAVVVLAIIFAGDLVMGQIVEPLSFGHRTGLSPIAVILSTAFWAFLWGPIGLLLATPLTVCLVVVGRHVEALSFMHVMLSDASPLEPAETFYQRALEANQGELVKQARADVAAGGLEGYFDQVALRGLGLAQADLSRDALAFDRLEAIHAQIEALLASLAGGAGAVEGALPPEAWRGDGAVLCIPGRGQLDGLAAVMAVQTLRAQGFGAQVLPNGALGSKGAVVAAEAAVRLCCISVFEEGSSATSIRFFIRRIQRRMPDAAVVVCLWNATAASATLAALRLEGREEFIVLSLGELTALVRAIVARGGQRVGEVGVGVG